MSRSGLLLLLALLLAGRAFGAGPVPDRFGAAVVFGHAYDPEAIDFIQLSGVALLDYERVWPHQAPEPLRFKVEASLGATTGSPTRGIVSAGIFALYYLDRWRTARQHPYLEAGVGLIYTDFQVSGQGLRLNFNPQAGIGTEIRAQGGGRWFTAFRLHHLSNGNLHKDNRGINSLVLQIGKYF